MMMAMETPSGRAGLPWKTEERFRLLGTQLVQMAGMLLGMPQAALLTGQTLFHQLYQRHSFLDLAVLVLIHCRFPSHPG